MALTTDLDSILKRLYLPPIRENFNRATVLMNALRVGNEGVSGTEVHTPLWYGYSQGVGARSEDQTLPSARKNQYKVSTVSLKTNYGRVELSGHLIRATKDDRGSFIRAIGSEIQNMTAGIKNDYNRQCFGDGTGALATINETAGTKHQAETITVDSTQYLRSDMPIMIDHTDGDAAHEYTITGDITSSTVVTNATTALGGLSVSFDDNDIIYRGEAASQHSKDIEIMGLKGLVYDTSLDIQGVDVSANSWWKPATGVAIDAIADIEDDLQTMYTNIEKNGGTPDLMVTTYAMRDNYAKQLQGQRRYANVMDFKGGFKGLEFNGLAIVPDKDCQDGGNSPKGAIANLGSGYMLDTSTLSFQTKSDWDWMDMDGAIWNRVTNKDAYEATIFYESNMVCYARNRNCHIYDNV